MEAKESAPRLDVQGILPSLGVFGDAMSEDKSSSQKDSDAFVKHLVFSTNDLVGQLDQLNDNIVKQFDSSERLLREELLEQKAKEKADPNLAYNSSFKEMNIILEEMKKTMKELLEFAENNTSDLGVDNVDIDKRKPRRPSRGPRRFSFRPIITPVAAIGGAGAAVATTAIVAGIDVGAKQIYNEGNEPLKMLEKQYGMEAIKNKAGFTEAYEIGGVTYPANKLPKQYQTLLDAYGPAARKGDGRTNAALKAIKDNPQLYESLKVNQPKYDPATQKAIDQFKGGGGESGGGGATGSFPAPNALSQTDAQKMFPGQFKEAQAQTPLAQKLMTQPANSNKGQTEFSTVAPEMTVTGKREPSAVNNLPLPQTSPDLSTMMNSESDQSIQSRFEKSSNFANVMINSTATADFSEQISNKIEEYTRTVDKMESAVVTAPAITMGDSGAGAAAPLTPSLSSFQNMGVLGSDEVPDPNYFGGLLEIELMA